MITAKVKRWKPRADKLVNFILYGENNPFNRETRFVPDRIWKMSDNGRMLQVEDDVFLK